MIKEPHNRKKTMKGFLLPNGFDMLSRSNLNRKETTNNLGYEVMVEKKNLDAGYSDKE